MLASSSTAVDLEPQAGRSSYVVQRENQLRTSTAQGRSNPGADPVLEASRIADSTVPDGGRGWVVIAACAVVAWWFVGTGYSWGVLQDVLVDEGVGSPSTLAFVGSLATGLMSALAIINARIIRRLGSRFTAIMGVTFLGLSAISSSFSVKNVAGLFFTNGVLLGLGLSLCFMVVSVTPAQYFSRKRGLANGIVFAGGGLGGAAISYGFNILILHIGPAWTFRALGIATLVTGLPAAWFIQERVPIQTAGFIEWCLFKDMDFVLIFIAGAIGTFPLYVPPFFIPLYSRSMGLSSSTGAGLLAGFNLASAVGRISCSYLCDVVGPLNTLAATLFLTGTSMLAIWPFSTTLASLVVFVIINGASNGGFFATMPTVVANTFGSARVLVAMGMIITGWVGGYLMGAPIAGYLLEQYGGATGGLSAYRPAMFYAGALALSSTGLVLFIRLRVQLKFATKV